MRRCHQGLEPSREAQTLGLAHDLEQIELEAGIGMLQQVEGRVDSPRRSDLAQDREEVPHQLGRSVADAARYYLGVLARGLRHDLEKNLASRAAGTEQQQVHRPRAHLTGHRAQKVTNGRRNVPVLLRQ